MNKINYEQLIKILDDVLVEAKQESAKNQGTENDTTLAYNIVAASSIVTRDILVKVLKHLDLYED